MCCLELTRCMRLIFCPVSRATCDCMCSISRLLLSSTCSIQYMIVQQERTLRFKHIHNGSCQLILLPPAAVVAPTSMVPLLLITHTHLHLVLHAHKPSMQLPALQWCVCVAACMPARPHATLGRLLAAQTQFPYEVPACVIRQPAELEAFHLKVSICPAAHNVHCQSPNKLDNKLKTINMHGADVLGGSACTMHVSLELVSQLSPAAPMQPPLPASSVPVQPCF